MFSFLIYRLLLMVGDKGMVYEAQSNWASPTAHSLLRSIFENHCSLAHVHVLLKCEESTMEELKLDAIDATPESFAEFGQVIEASPDDQKFGPHDAQLDLSQGIPRLYIMQLKGHRLKFSTISHHASVTQCLGSVGGHVWYLGVAKSSIISADEKNTVDKNVSRSRSGHFYIPPDVTGVRAFRISGPKYIMLNKGTWHEGPLFTDDTMDFYNLELSNTYVADQTTHSFGKDNGVSFVISE